MKKLFLLIFTAFLFTIQLFSQTPSWKTLPNAPLSSQRFEDIYFTDALTGIIIGYGGNVVKTTNGGNSWFILHTSLNGDLRSTGFFDNNNGIIGTLDQARVLFRTTNGGLNFSDITGSIQGIAPRGICGISIVNPVIAFACGKYDCPANVIKTTNAGLNWVSLPIDTSLVRSLVDCYFWYPDSGIVVGGYTLNNNFSNGKSVVLMTVNGGMNWTQVFKSTRNGEWCWKICFISRQIGFVSIEGGVNPTHFLKTTNGGVNWVELAFLNSYDEEGIGFVNENTGWIGGWTGPTYETTNGGTNWHLAGWGMNVNRFRFLSDTLAYAVGKTVYKYTREPIGIHPISTEIPQQFILHQNYPNPFNPFTKIKFSIPLLRGVSALGGRGVFTSLRIYNVLGKEIAALVKEELNPGVYEVNWDASHHPSGIYFYKMTAGEFTESKKIILIK